MNEKNKPPAIVVVGAVVFAEQSTCPRCKRIATLWVNQGGTTQHLGCLK